MKTCPHCMKTISETAKKCKFCWEWVENDKKTIRSSIPDNSSKISNKEDINVLSSKNTIHNKYWIIISLFVVVLWCISCLCKFLFFN